MTRTEYKTPDSIFTFGEIDDFCKEWGWIHITEFIKQTDWIDEHKPPYHWSCYGQGQFLGVDGNKYLTHNTYRTQWIGDIKNDLKNKEEFKHVLKKVAGDYYGKHREHYYFYTVEVLGGEPFNCYWMKEFEPNYEPNETDKQLHGLPNWKVILWHMGVTNGEPWGYKINA